MSDPDLVNAIWQNTHAIKDIGSSLAMFNFLFVLFLAFKSCGYSRKSKDKLND